jgi:hypothetical protein
MPFRTAALAGALLISALTPVLAQELTLPSLYDTDKLVVTLHPAELQAVTASGAAIDDNGLIGRNRDS